MTHTTQKWSLGFMAAFAAVALSACNSSTPAPTDGGTTPSGGGTTEGGTTTSARPAPTKAPFTVKEGEVIRIGLVASRQGELRPWGEDSSNGAALAMAELAADTADGDPNKLIIEGHEIQLVVQDSNSDPVQGKNAAEQLVNQGVIGLIGEVASGITATISDVAFSNSLPLVAVGATRTDLSAKGSHFFRVCYTDALQGPVMAKFAYEDLGLRKMAMFTDKAQPYSTGLSESFAAKFKELGGEIVDEQFYQTKDTQFAGPIANTKAKNPDGIFLSGYFNEVGPLARQIREAGMTTQPLLGGDGWDSDQLLTSGGDAIVGGYFCNHYNSLEDRPEVKTFLDAWKKKYNANPGTTMGALGYDSTKLMVDAVKRAIMEAKAANKPVDSMMVINALENTENFPGVSGAITLKGRNGDPAKRALVVEVTKEGQKFAKAFEADAVMAK